MCYCNSVPKLVATSITVTDTLATINLCGCLPNCGRFDVCLKGCSQEVCSGLPVELQDQGGIIYTAVNIHANNLTLGQASVQAVRHGVIHFIASRDYPTFAVMCDKVPCTPTPILPAESPARRTNKTTKSAKNTNSEV